MAENILDPYLSQQNVEKQNLTLNGKIQDRGVRIQRNQNSHGKYFTKF